MLRRCPRNLQMLESRFVLLLVGAFALPGCGDGGDPPNGPQPPQLSVQAIADELSEAEQKFVALNQALQEFFNLAPTIAPVMTDGAGFPDVATAFEASARSDFETPLLWTRGLSRRLASAEISASSIPLGVTCVWDVENVKWKGSEPIFGPVPSDGTRFELYATGSDRLPLVPLQPLPDDGFTDVRPIRQGANFDVELEGVQESVDKFLSPLTGSFDGSSAFSLRMLGGTLSDGIEILDFDSDLESQDVPGTSLVVLGGSNTAVAGDIIIDEIVTFLNEGTLSLIVSSSNQTIIYDIGFLVLVDLSTQITFGEVQVDGQTVANVSGSLENPSFSLSPGSPLPSSQLANLRSIFLDSESVTAAINDLALVGACVGARDQFFCEAL